MIDASNITGAIIYYQNSTIAVIERGQMITLRTRGRRLIGDVVVRIGKAAKNTLIEVLYKNEIIGSFSRGQFLTLHFNDERLTGDIVIKNLSQGVWSGVALYSKDGKALYDVNGLRITAKEEENGEGVE